MKFSRVSDPDSKKVENFLTQQSFLPIQQTLAWAEFQKTIGVDSVRIAVENDEGDFVAFVQLFIRKLPFGFTRIEIPRAPVWRVESGGWKLESSQITQIWDLLLGEIKKIAVEKKAVFVRFDFQKDVDLPAQFFSQLSVTPEANFPLTTLTLDLTQSEEELLAQMKPKGRYNIRVAQKHGIEVEKTEEVAEFYELLKKTTARDGFAAHSEEYYKKLLETLGEQASLLLAKKEGRAIGGILLTFAGDTCTYYYGASDHEFRKFMAPYLLQFEAIKMAKARGCRIYDFLGIAPLEAENHRLAGVSGFKRKFGGSVVSYPVSRVLVVRRFWWFLWRLVRG